jgi:hypothetical protein
MKKNYMSTGIVKGPLLKPFCKELIHKWRTSLDFNKKIEFSVKFDRKLLAFKSNDNNLKNNK